jgi:Periplasmic protein involved in polysaccharide export
MSKKYCLVLMGIFIFVMNAAAANKDNNEGHKYLLGAGDVIKVSVYDHPDLLLETQLADDGSINFPLIGKVNLNGLTFQAAESSIASKLDVGGFVRAPQVNILISEHLSQRISVIGEVNRPGRYPLDGKTSLIDMIANAGGISAMGSDTIVLIRDNTRQEFDIPKLMATAEQSMSLKAGDQLYIPRMQQIYVYGEVLRPGAYRLEPKMTVMQLLSLAGGFTPKASHRSIQIQRPAKDGTMEKIDVKLTDLVHQNDVIYIDESLF